MGGIAQGGLRPILLWIAMGLAIEAVALTIHDLDGLGHVFAVICMIFATFLTNFYRDPDRRIPKESGVVVSPADGRIMFTVRERATGRRPTSQQMDESADRIESDEMTGDWWPTPCENPVDFTTEQRWEAVRAGEEADTDALRVAIFMSPFDVHVNRVPIASTIERMEHRCGKGRRRGPFLPAYVKESAWNERVRTVLHSTGENGSVSGMAIEVTQISGRLARTIDPWTSVGDELRRGQRYGMIRLGSRVDVRVPAATHNCAVIGADADNSAYPKGESVVAGSSVLFNYNADESE